jgi:hypothetical protein
MYESDGLASALGSPVVLIVFVIVFVVCLRVLPEMGFSGLSGKMLAFCLAALSAMGLMIFAPERGTHDISESVPQPEYFLLLPYAALGLTLVLLPFIFLIYKWLHALMEGVRRDRQSTRTPKESSSQDSTRSAFNGSGRIERRAHDDRTNVHGSLDRPYSGSRRFR